MASWQAWKNRCGTALFIGAISTQAAYADPVLSVSSPNPAVPGSSVALDVVVAGITDLYAYQFTLAFNPAVLQISSVTEGSFLASGGGSTFFDGGSFNNTLGSVSFVFDTLVGATAGVNGSGMLARMTFNVVGQGTSTLNFSDALFLDASLATVPVLLQNGSITAVPEPAAYLMFGLGLAGLAVARRRQMS